MELCYPRFIHAEFMTHRAFSRNSASSRAIPSRRFIEDVTTTPAMPVYYGLTKPGTQAGEEADAELIEMFKSHIISLRQNAIGTVTALINGGLHKQIANRYLEPWFHIRVICSATDWHNFFKLRCSPMAQPEIQALADAMLREYVLSKPIRREFHTPYVEEASFERDIQTKVSVARCARVSYLNHDGKQTTLEKDLALYDRLKEQQHLSPFEHVAFATQDPSVRSGNFKGWYQLRQSVAHPLMPDLYQLAMDRGLLEKPTKDQ